VPPGVPGHSPGIGLPYDPDRARHLLAEAGYPHGRGFPLVDALSFRAVESRSEYLRAQWQQILGVEIAWETLEWTLFLDRLRKGLPQVFNAIWEADYPDPDNFLRVSRARTWARWRNEPYDRLVENARRATDQEQRMRLYGQADRILVDEAPILPLTYEQDHLLVKPWVSKYPTSVLRGSFWKDVIIEVHGSGPA
jgi:ABC-type oligopeptide transport system substrate-binding subunit